MTEANRLDLSGGTGTRLAQDVIWIAGSAALLATLASLFSIWIQLKNYRKPLLQRYVVRILLMVPIYAISSCSSIVSLRVAFWVDPIRDIYEAFTIYTFFQLLINFIGGERALIIMMYGREPVHHLWPLNHCLPKVDISDPHTFLAVKRGILQYAWLKPVLGLATIIMKSTNVYQEEYIGLSSGYLWSGIAYNISVTLSLYSLGMFWVCMAKDMQPFRPVPKFLCIKLIIFASYWQGFMLSILVFLNVIPDDVEGYTPDNLAAAMQDALICIEMPLFAIGHWYAFSWYDYADVTISAARLPVQYAIRDAFGIRDLIEDTKETFSGENYEYRLFDSGDNVLVHEESSSRYARMREGMRYERGGKGKYWIPKPGQASSRTPLLAGDGGNGASRSQSAGNSRSQSPRKQSMASGDQVEYCEQDEEEERLYERARKLEHGDWNYPVITAHVPAQGRWIHANPDLVTTSTNRHILQPTKASESRRKSIIEAAVKSVKDKFKGKQNATPSQPSSPGEESRAPSLTGLICQHPSASRSAKSDRSQVVDLIVEDTTAEELERVRARKEGSAGWNEVEPKRFVRTYGRDEVEDMREGFEPTDSSEIVDPKDDPPEHAIVSDENGESEGSGIGGSKQWERERKKTTVMLAPKYGLETEDLDNVWAGDEPSGPPKENP